MKVIGILNPTSGRGSAGRQVAQIHSYAKSLGLTLEILHTQRRHHAQELACEAAKSDCDIIAAIGGDGTIHEVLNGMIGSSKIMAAVPCGTGNDLCRTLGFGADWRLALDAIKGGNVAEIDVGKLETGHCTAFFHNIAGVGFDVAVAVRINTGLRKIRGTAAYVLGVLGTLSSYKPMPMKVRTDEKLFEAKTMLCAIANARSYGGAMKIAPQALLDDGFFDVVFVEETSMWEFITTFPKVFRGTHLNHKKVRSFRCKELEIETVPSSAILVDGELYEATPARFQIVPRALSIIVPKAGLPTG